MKQKRGGSRVRSWIRNVESVWECRDGVGKVEAHQHLSLERDLKGIKEASVSVSAAKRRLRKIWVFSWMGHRKGWVTQGFPPSLLSLLEKSTYSKPRCLQPERKLAAINIYLQQRDVRIGEHLNKMDIQKSKKPDRNRNPEGGAMRIWNFSQLSLEVHVDWGEFLKTARKQMVTLVLKKNSENYRSVSLISILEKRRWWRKKCGSHLQTSQGQEDDWKCGFTKGISCLLT